MVADRDRPVATAEQPDARAVSAKGEELYASSAHPNPGKGELIHPPDA
jgi:hypothetical protein